MASASHAIKYRRRQARSRKGCLTCRSRRKKCDEEKPTCLACQKNRLTCSWPTESCPCLQTGHTRSKNMEPDPFLDSRLREIALKGAPVSLFSSIRLPLSVGITENLSYYLTYTAKSLEDLTCPMLRPIWKGQVLEDSKEFSFIASSIDAVTLLHRARTSQHGSSRHFQEAYASRAASINEFRTSISEITPRNSSAVLAFAALQFILCLDFPRSSAQFGPSRIISAMSALISALRGFWNLQPSTIPFIKNPYIRSWAEIPQPETSEVVHNHPLLAKLRLLYEFIDSGTSSSEMTTCSFALVQLHAFLAKMGFDERDWNLLRTWPGIVPGEFISLIEKKNPLALLITTYWCVALFRGSGHWLLDYWVCGFPSAAATFIAKGGDLYSGFLSHALDCEMSEDILPSETTSQGYLCHREIVIPYFGRNPLVDDNVSKWRLLQD